MSPVIAPGAATLPVLHAATRADRPSAPTRVGPHLAASASLTVSLLHAATKAEES